MKSIAAASLSALMMGTVSAMSAPFPMTAATPAAAATGYTYTADGTGGSGSLGFNVPTLPAAYYTAIWNANFTQLGTQSAPAVWYCNLNKNGSLVGQATVTDSGAGSPISVTGAISLRVQKGDTVGMLCGVTKGVSWTWGGVPLQVTFVRLATRISGTLPDTPESPEVRSHTSYENVPSTNPH
jgi:hypothetical protein